MTSDERGGLVATIWVAMAIVAIVLAVASSVPGLMVIPIAVAVLMTFVMYLPTIIAAMDQQTPKAKREPGDKLALLLEMMDADERAAFKEALKRRVLDDLGGAEDGELPADAQTLAELLGEDRAQGHSGR